MLDVVKKVAPSIPFDAHRLDRLMDEAGIDVLLATSKHNVQYLLGGHRAFFFESMDAMGLSRYLPVLVYPKGAARKAAFFGHRMEGFQKENQPFWVSESQTNSSGTVESMLAVISNHGPGATKRELTEALRREETICGLVFDYCLITAGTSLNRAPSEQ